MGWTYLVIAGLFEVAFTTCLKYADGFTKLWPSLGFLVSIIASFQFLTMAIRSIPLGTAYAVWTGIGAVGTAAIGIAAFGEPATTLRLVFLAVIIGGVLGLKLVSA